MADWALLTREMGEEEIDPLQKEWGWLINASYRPLIVSIFGDPFFESSSGIYWLNTVTGKLTKVAQNKENFLKEMNKDTTDKECLHVSLAKRLEKKIGTPSNEKCYSYVVLPIFKEGNYGDDNFIVLSLKEHLGVTGSIHKQIKDLPDGEVVKMRVVE